MQECHFVDDSSLFQVLECKLLFWQKVLIRIYCKIDTLVYKLRTSSFFLSSKNKKTSPHIHNKTYVLIIESYFTAEKVIRFNASIFDDLRVFNSIYESPFKKWSFKDCILCSVVTLHTCHTKLYIDGRSTIYIFF
jgi:hypothetical protein